MVRLANAILLFGSMVTSIFAQGGQTDASQLPTGSQSPVTQSAPPASTAGNPFDAFGDFSAVMIGSRAEPGEGKSRSHIYRFGNQMRIEEPGGRAYFITDLNTGETYGIMQTSCIHDDHPYYRALPFHLPNKAEATVTRVPAGKEDLNGHACQVEDITISSPTLANPQKLRLWEAKDLKGFPIKIEFELTGGQGPIIRYTNVDLSSQDPTLFIYPRSCKPLSKGHSLPPASPPAKK